MFSLSRYAACATVALAGVLVYSSDMSLAAVKPTPPAAASSLAKQGTILVTQYGCNRCHGPDLSGRTGFTPSLHQSGILAKYNRATFARVLLTGVTYSGGNVKPPMPIYGPHAGPPHGPGPGGPGGPPPGRGGMRGPSPTMTKATALTLYAYLKSLK